MYQIQRGNLCVGVKISNSMGPVDGKDDDRQGSNIKEENIWGHLHLDSDEEDDYDGVDADTCEGDVDDYDADVGADDDDRQRSNKKKIYEATFTFFQKFLLSP